MKSQTGSPVKLLLAIFLALLIVSVFVRPWGADDGWQMWIIDNLNISGRYTFGPFAKWFQGMPDLPLMFHRVWFSLLASFTVFPRSSDVALLRVPSVIAAFVCMVALLDAMRAVGMSSGRALTVTSSVVAAWCLGGGPDFIVSLRADSVTLAATAVALWAAIRLVRSPGRTASYPIWISLVTSWFSFACHPTGLYPLILSHLSICFVTFSWRAAWNSMVVSGGCALLWYFTVVWPDTPTQFLATMSSLRQAGYGAGNGWYNEHIRYLDLLQRHTVLAGPLCVLFVSLVYRCRNRLATMCIEERLLWAYLGIGVLFLTFQVNKLPSYASLLVPALALLSGMCAHAEAQGGGRGAYVTFLAPAFAVFIIAFGHVQVIRRDNYLLVHALHHQTPQTRAVDSVLKSIAGHPIVIDSRLYPLLRNSFSDIRSRYDRSTTADFVIGPAHNFEVSDAWYFADRGLRPVIAASFSLNGAVFLVLSTELNRASIAGGSPAKSLTSPWER